MNNRKQCIVKEICDGVHTAYELKGYAMFDDRWIGEYDKLLYNDKGETFAVLDVKVIEVNTLIGETSAYCNLWVNWKHSCVKFDKNIKINVGDVFYTHL
jgi:hypothetical protein